MDSLQPPPAFTRPLVHVLATPDLDRALSSSNLSSLAAVLDAFSSTSTRSPTLNNVQVRTPPDHHPRTIRHFSIEFRDRPLPLATRTALERAGAPPPASAQAERRDSLLGGAVSQSERDVLFLDQLSTRVISRHSHSDPASRPPEIRLDPAALHRKKLRYDLEGNPLPDRDEDGPDAPSDDWQSKTLDDLTPWYTNFRNHVFARREVVEYETWGWPVACVLALSTAHPDPLNALSILWDLTSPSQLYAATSNPHEPPRHEYVNPDVLRYILIVHDARQGGSEQVEKLQETVKKTYGVHTKVLTLWDHYKPLELPAPGPDGSIARETDAANLENELNKLWPGDPATSAGRGEIDPSSQFDEDSTVTRLAGLGYPGLVEVGDERSAAGSPTPSRRGQPGHDLSLVDLHSLSVFTREFVTQSIVPFLERQVTVANEQFNNNKKSLGGRLFSVGRRYFGGGASASTGSGREASVPGGTGGGFNATKGYYPYSSLESQARRLADLSFMCEDYALALHVYGQAAKDFKGDRAWKHYSSALRMQGLCQLFLHMVNPASSPLPVSSASSSPSTCLETSILAPSSTSSSVSTTSSIDFDLLRATMLYHDLYSRLPSSSSRASCIALMRLVDHSIERARVAGTGGDEDELWTALVCEQSALSQLGINNRTESRLAGTGRTKTRGDRRERKFVLEMCLAGTRYEKSGLKPLSRRCLSQAVSLYSPRRTFPSTSSASTGPTTFEAIKCHLHHSLARQAYNASQPRESIHHFLQLLPATTNTTSGGGGIGGEEEGGGGTSGLDWLDDFALAWELSKSGGGPEPEDRASYELPTRLFERDKVRAIKDVSSKGRVRGGRGGFAVEGARTGGERERDEEEWRDLERVMEARTTASIGARGQAGIDRSRRRRRNDDDTVVAVVGETFYLELPVRNPLESEFLSIGSLAVHPSSSPMLDVEHSLDGEIVELAPLEARTILIPVRARTAGTYEFTSLSYRFHNLLPVTESFSSPISVRIGEPVPLLSIAIEDTTAPIVGLLHGQSRTVTLCFENVGQIALARLRGVTRSPEFATLSRNGDGSGPTARREGMGDHVSRVRNELGWNKRSSFAPLELVDELKPGETVRIQVSVRGEQVGDHSVKFLFTFEKSAPASSSSEVFDQRFAIELHVSPSLEVRCATRPNDDTTSLQVAPFLLDVEVYNSGVPASNLRITEIALVSPLWRLSEPRTLSTTPMIPWQGVQHVTSAFERVRRDGATQQCEQSIAWSVGQVEKLFAGHKFRPDDDDDDGAGDGDTQDRPGEVDLTLSSRTSVVEEPWLPKLDSILASHSRERLGSLAHAFPTIPRQTLGHIFPLVSPTSGIVVARFKCSALDEHVDDRATCDDEANSQTGPHRRQQGRSTDEIELVHTVPLAAVGTAFESGGGGGGATGDRNLDGVLDQAELKAGGLYEESQRERSMLIASLRANASEFGGGGGGRGGRGERSQGPVIVFVEPEHSSIEHDFGKQRTLSIPIRFYVRNLSPLVRFSYALTLGTTTASALVYTGRLTRRGRVGPLELVRIDTNAFVTRGGTYDVGGWSFVVTSDDGRGGESSALAAKQVVSRTEGEKVEVRVVALELERPKVQ